MKAKTLSAGICYIQIRRLKYRTLRNVWRIGPGPVIASTDYVQLFADQIRPYINRSFTVLGTDGYGRSDVRSELREHFEVDRHFVVVAALKALADEGELDRKKVSDAINLYGVDAEKPNPRIA